MSTPRRDVPKGPNQKFTDAGTLTKPAEIESLELDFRPKPVKTPLKAARYAVPFWIIKTERFAKGGERVADEHTVRPPTDTERWSAEDDALLERALKVIWGI